ncbi:MAG: hypothetical protein U0136_13395 [Bdellovibrionota bacterium]
MRSRCATIISSFSNDTRLNNTFLFVSTLVMLLSGMKPALADFDEVPVDPNAPRQIGKTCLPNGNPPYFRTIDSDQIFFDLAGRLRHFHTRDLLECYPQDCVLFFSDGTTQKAQGSACTVIRTAQWEIFPEFADTSEQSGVASAPPAPDGAAGVGE